MLKLHIDGLYSDRYTSRQICLMIVMEHKFLFEMSNSSTKNGMHRLIL